MGQTRHNPSRGLKTAFLGFPRRVVTGCDGFRGTLNRGTSPFLEISGQVRTEVFDTRGPLASLQGPPRVLAHEGRRRSLDSRAHIRLVYEGDSAIPLLCGLHTWCRLETSCDIGRTVVGQPLDALARQCLLEAMLDGREHQVAHGVAGLRADDSRSWEGAPRSSVPQEPHAW